MKPWSLLLKLYVPFCFLFLSIIIQDIEAIERINWEAVIVDDCQNSRVSKCLEQLKRLPTNFRMVLLSSSLKVLPPTLYRILFVPQVGHIFLFYLAGKYCWAHQSAVFPQPWRKWYIECFKWCFFWYSWHPSRSESKTCTLCCLWAEGRFFKAFRVLGSCPPFTSATRDVLLHITIELPSP